MRLLFLVRRAGPYHDARYEAAGRLVNLSVVQTRPDTSEYPWTTKAAARNYNLGDLGRPASADGGLRGRELALAMERCIEAANPDVLACTGWADPEYHVALRLCHQRCIPAIVMSDSTYQDEPRKWWKEFLKRPIVHGFSAAVVAGIRSRLYLRTLGFAPEAVFEPCDVVDNDHFSGVRPFAPGARIPPEGPYFLCTSRFLPKKNLFRLIEAYGRYRLFHGTAAWDLVILGSGELEGMLTRAIDAAGVESHVHRPGFLQYGDLPAFYARAGACVLPSLSDQWGLAVNEAMAAGVPVIVSAACGCAPDLVVEGANGFVFDPLNAAELARIMHKTAMLPGVERAKMGIAGRDRIARFTPQRFADALVGAARYAADRGKTPGIGTRVALTASAFRK